MRRWTCLAWSVSVGLSFSVRAAEPTVPPSPRVFGEPGQVQFVDFAGPPTSDESLPPSPINQLAPNDSASLPPMIASQAGTYSSPSTSPGMAAPAPAAAKPAAPKPPPQPWKPCFFDNDFSYKKDPKHTYLLGEEFKDMPLDSILPWDIAEDTRLSVGGELRFRYMDERNRLRVPFALPNAHNTYDLLRWRQYFDLKHSDWLRVYIEGIDASITGNSLPPTGIDMNRWDLLNAFVDLKVMERDDKPVWVRVGRQELQFGSQRLVSALDWANTRRNWDGVRINSPGTTWDLDAWLTNPVSTATFGTGDGLGVLKNDHAFDQPQRNILFGGAWGTYKGIKDHTIDTFFLYNHYDKTFPLGNGFPLIGPNALYSFPVGDRYTLGTRWLGAFPTDGGNSYLTDVEGGYQFGNDIGHGISQQVQAGYFTGGLGHVWKSVAWEPTIWGFYDWASGDNNKNDGKDSTFFQNYGLVHAYLGLIDNVARQNTSDINYRLSVKPTKKLQLQAAQHFISLANNSDSLYTITGQRFGAPGGHGRDVGQEVDLLATYTYNQNFSIEMGQFWFWYGDYIHSVQPARQDAQQFYVQTTFRY